MFTFRVAPSQIDIAWGLETAFDFLEESWAKWLPVAVGVAAVNLIVSALLLNIDGPLYSTNEWAGQFVWNVTGDRLLAAIAGTAILAIVGLAAGWTYTGIVIAGMRGRAITVGWIASRGLASLAAGILIAIMVAIVAVLGLMVLTFATLALGALALPLWIAAAAGAVVVGIRLTLVIMAIFDGSGPMDGIADSWDLTQGAVLRMIGWGIVAILIVVGFTIAGAAASLPFASPGLHPVAQGVSALASQIGSCFTIFLLAVLYESQQALRYAESDQKGMGLSYPRRAAVGRASTAAAARVAAPADSPMSWPVDSGSTSTGA